MANAAPGQLRLVQEFVNTLEMEPGPKETTEAIGTAESLAAWLADHGLLHAEAEVTAGDHGRAVELREALRRLLLANNGARAQDGDLDLLNAFAAASGLRPRFTAGGRVVLEPEAHGVHGALGRLLAAVSGAMNEGTWGRLKACADHECRWAFYDRSRNHSGHWCSMDVCGNRAKARQFRQRRRSSVSGTYET
jgi:predicted RNA-binding Zn ribbon-like protein